MAEEKKLGTDQHQLGGGSTRRVHLSDNEPYTERATIMNSTLALSKSPGDHSSEEAEMIEQTGKVGFF